MALMYIALFCLGICFFWYLCHVIPYLSFCYRMLNCESKLRAVTAQDYERFVHWVAEYTIVEDLKAKNKKAIQESYVDNCGVVRAQTIRWPNYTYYYICENWEGFYNEWTEQSVD